MPSIRLLATTLALSTLLWVAPSAQAAVVTGGNVDWGVKQSFRNYVKGPVAGGNIAVSDGASASGEFFRFPVTGGDERGPSSVSLGSRGHVRFRGHYDLLGENPQLDLSIYNVRVALDGTPSGPCLIADVDSKRLNGGGTVAAYRDLRLVKLDTAGITPAGGSWTNVPTALTPEAVPVFGQYQAGEAFDPVSFTYSTAAGSGTPAGACEKSGSVVTVPPGSKPPPSKPAGATLKLGKVSKSQLRSLASGKAVRTKVRVSQAGTVTLTAKGRIAKKTRTAAKVSKRASKPGVVSLRWKLGKSARRELARKKKLKLKLTASLPGKAKPAAQSFTLKAPKAKKKR